MACLVLGLGYLHDNNVLHRDIKPENLVLDEKGYLRITDFGIAKVYTRENSSETSGTPGYMSPEVMCAQNHTISVDYFAVGVIAYEFMNGRVGTFFNLATLCRQIAQGNKRANYGQTSRGQTI